MNEKNIFHSQFKAKNAATYAFFSGKMEKFLNLTVVKYLTYSMSVAGYVLHLSLQFWEMLFPSSHISNDKFKPPFKIYNSGCHRDFRRASRTRAEFSRKLQNVWVCIRAPRIFSLWRFPSLRATTDLEQNITILFLCSLDVANRWSIQMSQYKGEISSSWVTSYHWPYLVVFDFVLAKNSFRLFLNPFVLLGEENF